MDKEISKELMKILKKQGLNFHLQTKVDSIKKDKKGVAIKTTDNTGKKIKRIKRVFKPILYLFNLFSTLNL